MNHIQALIDRMVSYNGNFDGYPTMTCSDEALIDEAYKAFDDAELSIVAFLSYIASENVTNKDQYRSAKQFILDWVETCWSCNMIEGGNPVHREVEQEI